MDNTFRFTCRDVRARLRGIVSEGSGLLAPGVFDELSASLTAEASFRAVSSTLQVMAGTGFCGESTTFSSASVDTVRLLERGRVALAVSNAAASLLASVLICDAELLIARARNHRHPQ